MEIKVNKKTMTIIIVMVVAVMAVVLGIIATKTIGNNNIKNRLSEIETKELEIKIIEALRNTKLDVNTREYITSFGTFGEADDDRRFISSIELLLGLEKRKSDYKDFVVAFIGERKDGEEEGIMVPCFKIESDSNGKFKSIEYIDNILQVGVEKVIKDVLKEEFDVDIDKCGDEMKKIYGNGKLGIISLNDEVLVEIADEIRNGNYGAGVKLEDKVIEIKQEIYTKKIGIDIN